MSSVTGVLLRRHTDTARSRVEREAEIRAAQPQARKAGATRSWTGREGPSCRDVEGSRPCQLLGFRLLASRAGVESMRVVRSPPLVALWYGSVGI